MDRWPYAEQQPEKPKGFGTSDFSKRDEFALAIRMEQHRQQLRVRACKGWQWGWGGGVIDRQAGRDLASGAASGLDLWPLA